jgi:hypothetical protein
MEEETEIMEKRKIRRRVITERMKQNIALHMFVLVKASFVFYPSKIVIMPPMPPLLSTNPPFWGLSPLSSHLPIGLSKLISHPV